MATFLHVGRFPKSRNTRGGRAPKRREKVRTAREELCENGQIAACLIIGSHSPSFCPTFCYFFCCASGQICRLWRGEIISSSARYRAFTKRIIPPCWLIRTQWFNWKDFLLEAYCIKAKFNLNTNHPWKEKAGRQKGTSRPRRLKICIFRSERSSRRRNWRWRLRKENLSSELNHLSSPSSSRTNTPTPHHSTKTSRAQIITHHPVAGTQNFNGILKIII